MTERATELKLAVDIGSDPITGSVTVGDGAPISYCGWIELVAAIEAVRHDGGLGLEEPAAPAAAQDESLASGAATAAAPAEPALG